jgi:hypothetical protein
MKTGLHVVAVIEIYGTNSIDATMPKLETCAARISFKSVQTQTDHVIVFVEC